MKIRIICALISVIFILSMLSCIVSADSGVTRIGGFVDSSEIFADINNNSWYSNAVDYVVTHGYMQGVSKDKFGPGTTMSRAMLVTVLWRICGEPQSSAVVPFTDVNQSWYMDAVAWGYENRIILGVDDNTFMPGADISREQFAVIMFRYSQHMGYDTSSRAALSSYPDYDKVHSWADDALSWANAEGIITGRKDSSGANFLTARESTLRSEAAVILVRYFEKFGENSSYKNISCRIVNDFSKMNFSLEGSDYVLSTECPSDWIFTKNDDGDLYTITLDGTQIGSVYSGGVSDLDTWKAVSEREHRADDMMIYEIIERSGYADTISFRRRFSFVYAENGVESVITMIVDYEEAHQITVYRIIDMTDFRAIWSDTHFNALSELKDGSLLFLGNSFIGSSNIEAILDEMLENNDKNCKTTAYSWGGAILTDYISSESIMSNIRSGMYDGIFVCGFYFSGMFPELQTLIEACEPWGTKIIIFPAHNEVNQLAKAARDEFESVYFLDWQTEINSLVRMGVDIWEMCYDDQFDHSRPLAGYVGAHMVYRAIYGEVPSGILENSIDQDYVDRHLGRYGELGSTLTVHNDTINILK